MIDLLDRKQIPSLKQIDRLNVPRPEKVTLGNGIPVYVINEALRDVIKLELIFSAGRWFEPQKLVAGITARMLKEGIEGYSSIQLAELLDFYGASVKAHADGDHASIVLSCLNKHLPDVLPYLEAIVKNPLFPEEELNIVLTNNKAKLRVNKKKHEYLADRQLHMRLFGTTHPYGYSYEEEDYDQLSAAQLKEFHRQFYTASNCSIIAAGNINEDAVKQIGKYFGGNDWQGNKANIVPQQIQPATDLKYAEPIKNSFQSAIRIGRPLFNKTHTDYHKLSVLNAIFGGYFGSRLMSNIREDKGYTYGIYSGLSSMLEGGMFYVGTEVGVKVRDAAIHEIYTEMQRLKDEAVPEEEMQLIRNYLTGRLQSALDGPFRLAAMCKNLVIYGLDMDYVNQYVETINTVQQPELQELANQYFDFSVMHEITVG